MIKLLDDYNWFEVFAYAGEPSDNGRPIVKSAHPIEPRNLSKFTRADVWIISGYDTGVKDELDWIIYGQLLDGRWFSIEAWCNYTGWDCIAGGVTMIGESQEEIEQFGLTLDARKRLGVKERV